MPFDARYFELNDRCRDAIAVSEAAAGELLAYFGSRPDPFAQVDPARLARMRAAEEDAIAGLSDPDPHVRLAALKLFGPKGMPSIPDAAWEYTPRAAPAVLALATSDPDPEVQLSAAGAGALFYPDSLLPAEAARALAAVALRTGDVYLRNVIYKVLVASEHRRIGFLFLPGLSLDLHYKYAVLPLLFDAEHVQALAANAADTRYVPPRPASYGGRLMARLRGR